MKFIKSALLAASLISSQAFAGIAFDFRGDYNNTGKYSDGLSADVKGQSYFLITRARMKMNGNFNESLSYNTRVDFLKASTSNGDDGASNFVNYAELTNKFDDSYSLTVGKISDSGISAWEGQTSTGDMYFTSMSYYYPYLVGARFDAKFGSQSLTFYATNGAEAGSSANPNAADKTQGRTGLGLNYKGYFLDKSLNFIASYHVLPTPLAAASPFTDQNNIYMSAGLQYKAESLTFMLDYLANTYTGQGTLASTDATKNSIEATAKYTVGNWIPTLKYETSTIKNVPFVASGYYESNNAATSTVAASATKLYGVTMPTNTAYTNTVNQFAIGTEYKPKMEENFRYHIMYVSKATNYDSAIAAATNKTVTDTKIIAGVRIVADILK